MADLNATCALSITAETLSAWRDKQVKATTAEQLDQHVPTCAACERELTQFEMVARALHRQRELAPGNRIWRGVQTEIAGRRHPGIQRNSRAILSGISGVIIVVLLGFVFARVLGNSNKSTGPTATAIATPPPTVTTTPVPTASGSPTTTPINSVTIDQAWGPNAAQQVLTTPSDATHVFQAANITPDGTKLLGDEITFNPSGNADPSSVITGFLDIATRQFTDIGVTHGGGMGHPGCCTTDGRYLIAGDSDQPGVTCGACHERFWSYDLQTRQPAKIVATSQQFREIYTSAFDHGILVLNTGMGIQLEDLATLHVTPIATPGGNPSGYIASFTWPYLVYGISNVTATSTSGTIYIYDVATNSEILTQPNAIDAVITGDTLFYTMSSTTTTSLFELDHFTTLGAKPHQLAAYSVNASNNTSKLMAANGRIVLIDNGGSGYYEVWDRAEDRFVQITSLPASNNTEQLSATLSGNLLMITDESSTYASQQVAIYDTTKLPVR